jgi:hypothetical protein
MRLRETLLRSDKEIWAKSKIKRGMRGLTLTSSINLDSRITKNRFLRP